MSIWKPEVGDFVVITKSIYNWNGYMDEFNGKIVEITDVYFRSNNTQISFKEGTSWNWVLEHGHFRQATPSEITFKSIPNKNYNYLLKFIKKINKYEYATKTMVC